ncbi:MAG: DEAD/DEAH box helicase [Actinomycetota bacterium]
MNLFLDRDGLWTTVGTGRGVMRSIPTSSGMAPGRVWRRPVEAGLGAWLADRLDDAASPPTAGALALARLTALAIRAADERPVPTPDGEGWRWRAAPGPALAAELEREVWACVVAGTVVDVEPEARLRAHVDAVVDARIGAALDGPLPLWPTGRTGRAGAAQWADHVVARSAANARTVVVLTAPDGDGAGDEWTLVPLAVRVDEPTTRLPWVSADPAMFGADPLLWERWAATEMRMLRRAWGPPLPNVADDLATWMATYRTEGGPTSRLPFAPAPFVLGGEDVLAFLDQVALRLQDAGFDVVAPGNLLRVASVRRQLSNSGTGTGTMRVTGLGLDADVLVDGETLTPEEFAALAAAKSELVMVRGRWLRIGQRDAARLVALARRLRRPVTAADLLADEAFDGVDVDSGDVLPDGLRLARRIAPPEGVHATLRPYQLVGVEWLTWLAENGIGGILADDMGLGKTLQVLSLIRSDHPGPTLVVCPVTLVDTWARESERFTPDLRVRAFHGSARGEVAAAVASADVVVTTYGLLARDESLAEVGWHRVVLDEAQAIKNPDTRAARAARALTANHRLAVTGTPVENHLGDLWSLLAFAHPGLLPRRKQFMSRYADATPGDLARLRAVVGPFVLRRAKTDPGVLPDLPDRQVIREDCTLTREQVGAYEAVVADMMGALQELRDSAAGRGSGAARVAGGEPMKRRAAVLTGISKLKQICVHPALLTESRRALGERSGKVSRLVDLASQIVDEGQAVVVFTQFASFVPDLADHLRRTLGVGVATLTGADSRAARTRTVAEFSAPDGPPVLVASLKAGGTGLTLVRANHVIHLDRWWNPAVEDQASDRVWRIGQHQKVSVHVLVCPGTLEDRIDQTIAAKRELAGSVIRSADSAITELSDAGLAALVALVREEVLQ